MNLAPATPTTDFARLSADNALAGKQTFTAEAFAQVASGDADFTDFWFNQKVFVGVNSDGSDNWVIRWGHNMATGGRRDATKPATADEFEQRWLIGGVPGFERHVGVSYATDGNFYRPLSVWSSHADDTILTSMRFSQLLFTGKGGTPALTLGTSAPGGVFAANWNFGVGSTFVIPENNRQAWRQRNAAGNADVSLPYVNNGNVIASPAAVYAVGAVPTAGDSSGSFAYFNCTSGATGNRLLNVSGPTLTGTLIAGQFSAAVTDAFDFILSNANTASGNARPRFIIRSGGASGGDPSIWLDVNGVTAWGLGIDNSNADCFSIGRSQNLGTNEALRIDTSLHTEVFGTLAVKSYTVATLPTPGTTRNVAYASNLRRAGEGAGAGSGGPAYSDGTNWRTYYDNAVAAA